MENIVKPRTYLLVFVALLGLTAATLRLASVDLGAWHTPVGLAIAAAKALLVILFFMHALRGAKLVWVVAVSAVFWLGLLIFLTLMDYLSRSWSTY